jgi:DNA-binding transcriptional LysR family regulator
MVHSDNALMRRVSLRHLRCFLAVAETGSFTLASAKLFQTQSSLTATIQQFEEAVGLKLFERTTRRVELTAEARAFRPMAEKVVRDFEAAIGDLHAISKNQKGHMRIAAAPSMVVHILSPALARFRQDHPGITVSVQDAGSARIEDGVLAGEVDFGIASRLRNYSELVYTPIVRDPFGAIVPMDHPLAAEDGPITWAEVRRHEYIGLTNDTGIGAFLEQYPELRLDKAAHPYDYASSTTSLYAMLRLGGKISVVPALVAQASPMTEFKFRELEEPRITREICLITRQLRSLSVTTARILQLLMDTLNERPLLYGATLVRDRDGPAKAG